MTWVDAGVSWQRSTPVPRGSGWVPTPGFFDTARGLAVQRNGAILRTEDGGSTWTPVKAQVRGPLSGLALVGDSVATVVGAQIWRSTNGGNTWMQQVKPYRAGTLPGGVAFTDRNTGIICGWAGGILRTDDGGAHWSHVQTPWANAVLSVRFLTAGTAVAVGGGGLLIRTTDAGRTWSLVESGTRHVLRDVAFLDARTGWAVGNFGVIIKTTNGGLSWTRQESGTEQPLSAVAFADELHGIVTGWDGQVHSTSDGGRTWMSLQAPTLEPLTSAVVSRAGRVFVTGRTATLLELVAQQRR